MPLQFISEKKFFAPVLKRVNQRAPAIQAAHWCSLLRIMESSHTISLVSFHTLKAAPGLTFQLYIQTFPIISTGFKRDSKNRIIIYTVGLLPVTKTLLLLVETFRNTKENGSPQEYRLWQKKIFENLQIFVVKPLQNKDLILRFIYTHWSHVLDALLEFKEKRKKNFKAECDTSINILRIWRVQQPYEFVILFLSTQYNFNETLSSQRQIWKIPIYKCCAMILLHHSDDNKRSSTVNS